jgi:hypothetical protein
MAFPRECYDAKTLDFMTHVLESAWRDVERLIHGRKLAYTALRTLMSVRIMAGVRWRGFHAPPPHKKIPPRDDRAGLRI